ncbi:MAG: 2-oxoacid:acceptor oxidoreductase family protein [Promethearchaeota archaeon]
MTKRYEIHAIGYGGQGVISLSMMITKAIVNFENKYAVQTEAYSAAARGGKCWADVVANLDGGESSIDYPRALTPYDFIFILSNEAAMHVKESDVKEIGGWIVWDSSVIRSLHIANKRPSLGIPVQELAVRQYGNLVHGSAILFGAFTSLSGVISKDAAMKALSESVPAKTLPTNINAFEHGFKQGEEARKDLEGGASKS